MVKTQKNGWWPGVLQKKNCNLAIQFCFKFKIKKRYGAKVQKLCKALGFAFEIIKTAVIGPNVDQAPLQAIVLQLETTAPLLSSMVQSVGPLSRSSAANKQLVSMKQVAILAILCRLAHRNKNNYFSHLVALYMYSASARVNAITF